MSRPTTLTELYTAVGVANHSKLSVKDSVVTYRSAVSSSNRP